MMLCEKVAKWLNGGRILCVIATLYLRVQHFLSLYFYYAKRTHQSFRDRLEECFLFLEMEEM